MQASQLPSAFILFGGFFSGKYPEFIYYLKSRQIRILVIDEWNARSEAHLKLKNENLNHPFSWIDNFSYVQHHDFMTILYQVQKWAEQYHIVGTYSIVEHFVSALGLVADYFNLPNPGLRATKVCRDKFLQRLYLKEWSPFYQVITSKEDLSAVDHFPIVIKPTGRQASSGVVLVTTHEELQSELQNYEHDELLLLESYVIGEEFSVEALVQKGEVVFQNITQKRTNHSNSRYFVETAHTVPAQNLNHTLHHQLCHANQQILQRLDFRDGIAHAEFKITQDDKVVLMEIAARNPGDAILQLYFLATGCSLEAEILKIALGELAHYPAPVRVTRQVYLEHSQGRLIDVQLSEMFEGFPVQPVFYREVGLRPYLSSPAVADCPSLREILIEKSRGEELGAVHHSGDRCGFYLIDATTVEELDQLEKQVSRHLHVITAIH